MIYNLTNVTNASNFAETALAVNAVANTYLFASFIIGFMVVAIVAMKQLGYDMATSILAASMAAVFLAGILLFIEAIGTLLFSILMAVAIFSLVAFLFTGN